MKNYSNSPKEKSSKDELIILRNEIIESQKSRVVLLQYKLIAVASVATLGLGFIEHKGECTKLAYDFVLCIIPFVCVYIDLLCYHNTLRILVIARYLRTKLDPYEVYIRKLQIEGKTNRPEYLFGMEDFALLWSSIFLSTLLIIYGLYYLKGAFVIVGYLGAFISWNIENSFKERKNFLSNAKW
jgi:hypothetical protein